jgi:Flp pilus assembly protein TadG
MNIAGGRLAQMRKALANFRAARQGNVVLTFALALIPVFGLVGAAVDFSRGSSTRAALQSALDSAALMLSKEAPTLTTDQIQQKANDYFRAMFTRPEAQNIQVTATYDKTSSTLVVNGSTTVPTTISRLIGQYEMPIGASSTIKWGMSRLRVALALDTTGSMDSAGKIDALKTATKGLLATLKAAAMQNGDVYVSIIPFSKDVNVGASNYNANWINWTYWDAGSAIGPGNGWICLFGWCFKQGHPLTPQGSGASHDTWNGCIMDRGAAPPPGASPGWDQKVDLPTGSPETKWPAEQYSECPQPMIGLTYDWNALNAKVESLTPNGSTNQPIGLVWAWQSLVGGGPLTVPAKDGTLPYTEAIILMSDGLNTEDRWYSFGHPNTDVDKRMQHANGGTCKNIKDVMNADGKPRFVIYTVQVNTDGDPESQLLKDCASPDTDEPKGPKFFHLTSANQMVSTFSTIGTKLAKLRIAK